MMQVEPFSVLSVEKKVLQTYSTSPTTMQQHGLATMPGKVWVSTILKDGTSIVWIKEVSTCVTTIPQPMMMPSSMVAIGIGLIPRIQISILHQLNEKQPCKTLRVMQDGAVAVFSS